MAKQPAIYLLASRKNGTLYIGVTSNLVHRLVYFELHADMADAIGREKQLNKWNRSWKIALIERNNPRWLDLWEQIRR